MAFGLLRINIVEWPFWSLREFDNAFEAWHKINVQQPWEIERVISYYVVKSQGAIISDWKKLHTIPGEKRKKAKKAKVRLPTKEEQEFLDNRKEWQITPF